MANGRTTDRHRYVYDGRWAYTFTTEYDVSTSCDGNQWYVRRTAERCRHIQYTIGRYKYERLVSSSFCWCYRIGSTGKCACICRSWEWSTSDCWIRFTIRSSTSGNRTTDYGKAEYFTDWTVSYIQHYIVYYTKDEHSESSWKTFESNIDDNISNGTRTMIRIPLDSFDIDTEYTIRVAGITHDAFIGDQSITVTEIIRSSDDNSLKPSLKPIRDLPLIWLCKLVWNNKLIVINDLSY